MLANTGLEYQIIKGLRFKSTFGFEAIINNRNWFVPSTLQSDNAPTANINNPLLSNVRARVTQGTNYNYVSENTLNYITRFGKNHSLTLLAGYSFQKTPIPKAVNRAKVVQLLTPLYKTLTMRVLF
jgi:hypothetical protein